MISEITYQNQKRKEIENPPEIYFATVLGVHEDGLNLIFDGETESINKRYRYNKSITFKIGDRVKVTKVSGTYLVEYPIGKRTVSLAPGNIKMMSYQFGDGQLSVTWTDPDDTVIDGVTVSRWAGTYLVRNEIDYPKNETNGTVVLNSTTRNAYSSTPYIDSGLQNGKKYYYALFPYSDDGKVNRNPENRLGGSPYAPKRYGVRISHADSNPDTRVEYLFDAVGKRPARLNQETGEFDYGDWADVGFVKDNKPCMLRKDGTVDYYLNPSNYDLKEDGSPSDASNTGYDGNVMSEFPLWWLYQYQDNDYDYIILSEKQLDSNYHASAFTNADSKVNDKFYVGIYLSSYPAKSIKGADSYKYAGLSGALSKLSANGKEYNLHAWSERDYISALLIVLSKSTDLYKCFWNTSQVKDGQFTGGSIFHLSGYGGFELLAGILYIKEGVSFYTRIKPTPPYNSDGTSFEKTDVYFTHKIGGYSGYVRSFQFSKLGKIPKDVYGSETTYYPVKLDINASRYNNLEIVSFSSKHAALGVSTSSLLDYEYYARLSCHP